MKKRIIPVALLMGALSTYGQVGIGTNTPNKSAELTIVSSERGLLIPQVPLTDTKDTKTIKAGNVNSLMVFNTTKTAGVIEPGYYYWDAVYEGGTWQRLVAGNDIPAIVVNNFKDILQSTNIEGDKIENLIKNIVNTTEGNVIYKGDTLYSITKEGDTYVETPITDKVTHIEHDEATGDYIYYNEDAVDRAGNIDKTKGIRIKVKESVINKFGDIINNKTVQEHITNYLDGTHVGGNVYYDGTKLTYVTKEGDVKEVSIKDVITANETETTLIKNEKDGTYTYTNEKGVETIIDIPADVLNNVTTIVEGGVEIDGRTFTTIEEYVTHIAKTKGGNTKIVYNQEGDAVFQEWNETTQQYENVDNRKFETIVRGNESVTVLLPNADGTFTYYNEKEVDAEGKPVAGAKGVEIDPTLVNVEKVADGYSFTDAKGKEIAKIDLAATNIVFNDGSTQLGATTVQGAIELLLNKINKVEGTKAALKTDGIIEVNGANSLADAVLVEATLTIKDKSITSDKLHATVPGKDANGGNTGSDVNAPTGSILVSNADGTTEWKLAKDIITERETVTTLVKDKDEKLGTYTYTNEAGEVTVINIPADVLHNMKTIIDGGVTIDGVKYNTVEEYIAYLAKSKGGNTKIVYNQEGDAIFQEWNEEKKVYENIDNSKFETIVRGNETVTKLEKKDNGTFTYYNEAELDAEGNVLTGKTGVTIDPKEVSVKLNETTKVYEFKNSAGDVIGEIDANASAITFDNSTLQNLGDNVQDAIVNLYKQIQDVVSTKGDITTDSIIHVNDGKGKVLFDVEFSVNNKSITNDKLSSQVPNANGSGTEDVTGGTSLVSDGKGGVVFGNVDGKTVTYIPADAEGILKDDKNVKDALDTLAKEIDKVESSKKTVSLENGVNTTVNSTVDPTNANHTTWKVDVATAQGKDGSKASTLGVVKEADTNAQVTINTQGELGIAENAITSKELANNAVTNENVAAGAISADKMTSFTTDGGTKTPAGEGQIPVADGKGGVTYQEISGETLKGKALGSSTITVLGGEKALLDETKIEITGGTEGQVLVTSNVPMKGADGKDLLVDGKPVYETKWVDAAALGNTVTASNGLTKDPVTNNITLGGTLDGNTTITTAEDKRLAIAGLEELGASGKPAFDATLNNIVVADKEGVLKQTSAKNLIEDAIEKGGEEGPDALKAKGLKGEGITVTAGKTAGTGSEVANSLLKDVTLGIADGAVTADKVKAANPSGKDANGKVTYKDASEGSILVSNADGTTEWKLADTVVKDKETVTTLVANTDGTFTYYNEDQIGADGKPLPGVEGVTIDPNLVNVEKEGNSYVFKDAAGKEIIKVNFEAGDIVYNDDKTKLGATNVQGAIEKLIEKITTVEGTKGALGLENDVLEFTGGTNGTAKVLADVNIGLKQGAITTDKLGNGAVTSDKVKAANPELDSKGQPIVDKDGKVQYIDAAAGSILVSNADGTTTWKKGDEVLKDNLVAGEGVSVTSKKDATGKDVVEVAVVPGTDTTLGGVKGGSNVTIATDGTLTANTAKVDTVGVIKPGAGLEVAEDGTLTVDAGNISTAKGLTTDGKIVITDNATATTAENAAKALLKDVHLAIGAGAIGTTELADNAVTNEKIAAGAVTEDKMGAGEAVEGAVPTVVMKDGKKVVVYTKPEAENVNYEGVADGILKDDKNVKDALDTLAKEIDKVESSKKTVSLENGDHTTVSPTVDPTNANHTTWKVDVATATGKGAGTEPSTLGVVKEAADAKVTINAAGELGIGAKAVGTTELADNAVTNGQLADAAVTTNKISSVSGTDNEGKPTNHGIGTVLIADGNGKTTFGKVPGSSVAGGELKGVGITVTAGEQVGEGDNVAEALLQNVTLGIAKGAVTTDKIAAPLEAGGTDAAKGQVLVTNDKGEVTWVAQNTVGNLDTYTVDGAGVILKDTGKDNGAGGKEYAFSIATAQGKDGSKASTLGVVKEAADAKVTINAAGELGIGAKAVGTTELADAGVTTEKLDDKAVTADKLNAGEGDAGRVGITNTDGSVTYGKLQAESVEGKALKTDGIIKVNGENTLAGSVLVDATLSLNLAALNSVVIRDDNYKASMTDVIILMDASERKKDLTVTLPDGLTKADKGKTLTIKKHDAMDDFYINVAGDIVGVSNGLLYTATPYAGWDLVFDGEHWQITNKF